MPSILNATTTSGLVTSADNSGSLQLQTNNGTTAVTIDTSQNVLIGGTTFDNGGFSGGANGLNVVDATHPIVLIKESTTGTKAFFGASSTLSYLWTPSNIPLAFGTNDAERMRITSGGDVSVVTAAKLGYGTGAGGTVTQATNKSTAVTLNKPTGRITTNNAALGAGATVSFSVNCNVCSATDLVLLAVTGGSSYTVQLQFVSGGVFNIRLTNTTGGSLSEAVDISYAIISGSTS